ncbi:MULTISPECIES: type II toxin-antitoxin system HicB family antitoxin [unclassified Pseudodesulfovibrio]|uniref:type II toxin-antitoxin system HicB family antitoxin n=1 Tax=unclassified Pseudodesulfovibrio TaxID=2661612 RepID=UPI000FEB9D7B|nr:MULTISPECIES: type II toxin-antitoxin system HicB family antitoxin [unclassified Pseudodesulfovibrio]MCJ2164120.1 type II toxin-antitoxin system HicB family antitoxin [Pseudodesulfovibrio sp. S3-i]RWU05251.1 HicB family protein [Pseudodesulfovibrio sp. S3]
MQYVAFIEEEKRGYSVTFPDIPECTTFGDNLDEAVDHAHEALAMFVESLVGANEPLPPPSKKKELLAQLEGKEIKAINISVEGDGSDFEEFEMVMHAHLLGRIEKYCRQYGISPADFLAAAAREAIKSDIFSE